ncbi:sensor domain-containing diguanylate cyclase [Leptospira alstonii]|uniref:diguanylate cyclase n=2 Tax=Leptospira alstonii TaxID=28452 RepID=M6CXX1_9LEPT|nr:sensor domain-containing diguanylate cyclase [Leptospira alstonii]EMJ96524.1 diguanylate cyclase (GGDEF) domain protein [Leptospira alstonii serovar Sichuan str. 79601]EQA79064.1 diguanylate cyclase (GGDEF) domain protein [Leptospira alstonii serovar Pingchang str. 80-412]
MSVYQNETRLQRKTILMVLAIIPILIIGTFVYEAKKMQNEIYRVVWMRAKVTQDYIQRISNQTRALGLSITHSMTYYEDTVLNAQVSRKFKNYPSLQLFGIKDYNRKRTNSSTAEFSGPALTSSSVTPYFLREVEAALNLSGQFDTLVERQSEVVWVYYVSAQKFLYFAPQTKPSRDVFNEGLYKRPFWAQAKPEANPDRKQIITELYNDIGGQGLMITVSEPVYFRDRFIGVVSIDIGLDTMRRVLGVGNCIGESILIDENKKIIAKISRIDLNDSMPQVPNGPAEKFFLQGGYYWAFFDIKENEVRLVHRISAIEFLVSVVVNLLPFWGLICALGIVLILYIKLKTSMEHVSKLIHTDPLTGIANRRGFLRLTQKSLAIGTRHGQSWTILMIDIDHFKQVNDKFGHDMGDRILVKVSQILNANIRQTDAVCRWGGEEFAVFLFGANPEDSANIAEHLRKEIESKVILQDGRPVTLSIGISEGRGGKNGLENTFARADQALYQAKTLGRNRVCISDVTEEIL